MLEEEEAVKKIPAKRFSWQERRGGEVGIGGEGVGLHVRELVEREVGEWW